MTKDDRSVKIYAKKNGYVLGLNDKGTIYLAFPGETADNPHMYLGKENQENLENAKKVFERFARIGDKTKDSNFTVAVLNNLELAKKAEVKVLANKNLSRAKEIIEEHKGKGYLPGEVKRMEERLAQATDFVNGKFKTKDAEKQLKSFEVKIGPKPGLPTALIPFEKITVKASSKSDAKKRWEETNTSGGTKVYEVKEAMVKDDNKSEVKSLAEKVMLRYSSGLKIKRWYSHDTTVVATIDVSKMVGGFDERHFTKVLERAKIPGVKTIYMDGQDVVFELKYKVGDAIPSNLKKDKYVATKAKADAEMNRMIGSRDQFKIEREGVAGFVYKFRANGKIAGYYNDMSGDLYYDPKVMVFDSKPKVKDSKTAILTKVYDSLTNMESIIKDKK